MKKRKLHRRKGMTLIELVLVMAISALLLAMGIVNTRKSTNAAGSRGVAEIVAAEFRAARQTAIAQQTPVAVVFPNGGCPCSQSYYILQGFSHPYVARSSSLKSVYPSTYLFVGQWNLNPSGMHNPSSVNTLTPPDNASNSLPSGWLSTWGSTTDFMFVFTPSGTVITNSQPYFDGSYHVVVTDGASYAGGPPAQLTGVCEPYTISLSPLGAAYVSPGVVAGAGLQMNPGPIGIIGAVAVAPGPSYVQGSTPTITSVSPGGTVTTGPDGNIQMQVTATGSSSAPLFCEWNVAGVDPGTLSASRSYAMQWDPTQNAWTSAWTWNPPSSWPNGGTVTLTCTVDDHVSQSTTALLGGVTNGVACINNGKLAFVSSTNTICTMNPDGSDRRSSKVEITGQDTTTNVSALQFSPDGTKLACLVPITGGGGNGPSAVYVLNRDFSGAQTLWSGTTSPGPACSGIGLSCLGWQPQGSQLLIACQPTTASDSNGIYNVSLDGTATQVIAPKPLGNDNFPTLGCFRPQDNDGNFFGSWFLFVYNGEVYARPTQTLGGQDAVLDTVPVVTTNSPPGQDLPLYRPGDTADNNPVWDPVPISATEAFVAYSRSADAVTNAVYRADVNFATTPASTNYNVCASQLHAHGSMQPRYSRDGTKMFFLAGQSPATFYYKAASADYTSPDNAIASSSTPVGLYNWDISPNGSQILYSDGTNLFRTNIDGTGTVQLTHEAASIVDTSVVWSPYLYTTQ